MPNVNLIAVRREEKRQVVILTRQLFLALAGVILWYAGASVTKGFQIRALDDKLKKLQPKLDRIAQRQRDIEALTPKVDTLDNARTTTLRWAAMMDTLSDAVPNTIWISSLGSQGGNAGDPIRVSVRGTGPSQAVIAEMAQRLNQNGIFDHVNVPNTSNGSSPEDPVQKVSFDMDAFLKPVMLSDSTTNTPTTPPLGTPGSPTNGSDNKTVPTSTSASPSTGVAGSAAKP